MGAEVLFDELAAAVDTNSFKDAFERIIEANSRYYPLGYTPPTHPRDGRFHRIDVRLRRPGLRAVARRGYPSPSGKTSEERKQEALERWTRDRRTGGANDTSHGAKNWTAFSYTARLPLKDIAPGRYLLRVEAQDRAVSSASRPAVVDTVVTIR